MVIAIDGPAASGKSTTAKLVAAELGYLHVDTGAMYRAVTLKLLRKGIVASEMDKVADTVRSTHIELKQKDGSLKIYLDGEDVTEQIRGNEVTRRVSSISSLSAVRETMVREQRRLGERGGIVLEGRDIGTVVFPDADLKIFMVASIEARARRRKEELHEKGVAVSLDQLIQEIRDRDMLDSTRAQSPLKKANDAIQLDTSELSITDQVEFVVQEARKLLTMEEHEGNG